MKKSIRQRPLRGIWDWIATGDWDGGQGSAGGQHG